MGINNFLTFEHTITIIMITVFGTYQNGYVTLDKDYSSNNPVKVIITFLEEVESKSEKYFSLTDFSFAKSKKNLENFKGSLSDTLNVWNNENILICPLENFNLPTNSVIG